MIVSFMAKTYRSFKTYMGAVTLIVSVMPSKLIQLGIGTDPFKFVLKVNSFPLNPEFK